MKIRVGITARDIQHFPADAKRDRDAFDQQELVFYPGGMGCITQTFRVSSASGFKPFPIGDFLSVVDFHVANNRIVPLYDEHPQSVDPFDFYTLPADDVVVDTFIFPGEFNKSMKRFMQTAEVLRDGRPSGETLPLYPQDESELLPSGFGRGLLRLSQFGSKRPDGSRGFPELRFRLDDLTFVSAPRAPKPRDSKAS